MNSSTSTIAVPGPGETHDHVEDAVGICHQCGVVMCRGHIQQVKLKISRVIDVLNTRFVDDAELRRIDADSTSFINLKTRVDLEQFKRIKIGKSN